MISCAWCVVSGSSGGVLLFLRFFLCENGVDLNIKLAQIRLKVLRVSVCGALCSKQTVARAI